MKFLLALLATLMAMGFFAGSTSAQSATPGATQASRATPGAGRDVTHADSASTIRFEGLTEHGSTTSGTRWIRNGDFWQKSGTWVKDGHNIKCYADDGTLVFTNRGAGNFANSTGPVTDHLGGRGTTWNSA